MLKSIPGYPEYMIGDKGEGVFSIRNNLFLKEQTEWTGYKRICLMVNKNRDFKKVHVLVMLTFIGKKEIGIEVNHKDGNKANNLLSNLEYVTTSENRKHAYRLGLRQPVNVKGERHHLSIITKEDSLKIKKLLNEGNTLQFIADKFNVSLKPIFSIKKGTHWTCT